MQLQISSQNFELAEANKFKAMIFSAASVCDDLIGCKIIATTAFND